MADAKKQRRFEMLLLEHRKIVFKVASIYARGTEDRNDLAQEIRVQLWRSFGANDEERGRVADEHLSQLYAFVGRLDDFDKALILLYFEDRGHAEIANILGISETNVSTKLSRIKQRLRDQMTGPPSAPEKKHGIGGS